MRALIVDDNSNNLNLFKIILERKGFDVITAANGEDALQKLHDDSVDIIVSDILMPIMDGFHLLQECKSDVKLRNIPFAFVTGAFLDARDEELALKLGVQAFIRKPVEPNDFVKTLEGILARKPEPKKRGRPPRERKDGDAEKLVSINLMQKLEAKMADLEEEIVERKKTEEALRNSEAQYRALFETMAQGVIYYDAEGTVISINPAAERILGLTRDQLIGRALRDPAWRFINEDGADLPMDKRPVAMVLNTGKMVRDVVMGAFNPVDSMFHWVNVSAQPQFREDEEKPYRVFATFDDITDRFLSYKAIQESESRITAIMENTHDSIWSVDSANRLITANNAARELFLIAYGIDLREGEDVFASLPEESRKSGIEISKRGFKGERFTFERHYDFENGPIDLEISVNPIVSPAGQITGVSFFGRDMTQQHRTEKDLEESEERYRMLIDNSAEEIFVLQNGQIKFAKEGLSKITGYNGQEIMSKSLSELVYPDDLPDILTKHAGRMSGGEGPSEYKYRVVDKSGNIRWVEAHTTTIKWEDRPAALIVQRDITDRVNLESAVQDSEEKYRKVVENAVELIVIVQDGTIKFSNRTTSERMGYTWDELISRPFLDFIYVDDRQMVRENHIRRLRGEHIDNYAFRLQNRDGSIGWVEVRAVAIEWEGRPATLNFLNDITERRLAEDSLRKSEEKYRTILEQMDDSYYEVDSKGNFTFFNDALIRQMGYSREELLGLNYKAYIPPGEIHRAVAGFSEVFNTGKPQHWLPLTHMRKDGKTIYVEDSISPLRDEKGEIIGLRGISRDVSEHRKTADQLRRSEEKYRLLVESSLEGIVVIKAGTIIFTNKRLAELTGYAVNDLIGESVMQLFDPEDRPAMEERYRQRLRGELADAVSLYRIRTKDDRQIWVELSAIPIEWEGEPSFLYFANDITQRKLAEDALRKSEENYRNILEQMDEGYYEVDRKGNFTFVNDAMCRQMGYTREEALSMNYKSYVPAEDISHTRQIFSEVFRTGVPVLWHPFSRNKKDGTLFYIEGSVFPVRNDEGEIVALRGMTRDVTERKRALEALQESEEKYRLLVESSMEGIHVLQDGIIKFANPKIAKIFDTTVEKLIGRRVKELLHPDDIDAAVERYRARMRGEPIEGPYQLRYKAEDGRISWIEVSGVSILWENKPAVLYFSSDVTARKLAEDAMRQSEEKYRTILEEMDEVYYELDLKGNYTFFNDALCRQLGYSREELQTLNYRQYMLPEHIPNVRAIFNEVYRTGQAVLWLPLINIKKDGSRVYVEDSIYPIKNNLGEVTGFRGISRDVTGHHKAQEQLELRALLLDTSTDSIVMHDFAGNFKYVNEAAYKTKGYTKEELMAMKLDDLIFPEDAALLEQRKQEIKEMGCVVFEGAQRRKDGSIINIEVQTRIIEFEGEKLLLSVEHDITERKKAETALQESEQRYRSLFEYNPVAIYLQDFNGAFLRVNDATSKLTGYSREELLGMQPEQLIVVEDLKKARSNFTKAAGGEPRTYEVTIITKSGEKRNLNISNLSVVVNENIVGVYSVAEDVTERNKALEKINSTLEGTIEAIAMMSELRDPYTAGHQKMVTQLAMAIANEMGLPEDQIKALRVAGLLHDVGKVYVPSEILSKPGKLSDLERGLAKTHASASYDIVKAIKFPWPVCRIIIQHHERLDGSGYPKGIKGDEIILEARILAVADVVEAMTSHRPYRPALGIDKALEEITMNRGVLYDETVVDACVTLFKEQGFKFPE